MRMQAVCPSSYFAPSRCRQVQRPPGADAETLPATRATAASDNARNRRARTHFMPDRIAQFRPDQKRRMPADRSAGILRNEPAPQRRPNG